MTDVRHDPLIDALEHKLAEMRAHLNRIWINPSAVEASLGDPIDAPRITVQPEASVSPWRRLTSGVTRVLQRVRIWPGWRDRQ